MQASQVYSTMKISELTRMVSFFDFSTVEKLIVEAVKYNYVQMKVDHLREVVSFGSQVNSSLLYFFSKSLLCVEFAGVCKLTSNVFVSQVFDCCLLDFFRIWNLRR